MSRSACAAAGMATSGAGRAWVSDARRSSPQPEAEALGVRTQPGRLGSLLGAQGAARPLRRQRPHALLRRGQFTPTAATSSVRRTAARSTERVAASRSRTITRRGAGAGASIGVDGSRQRAYRGAAAYRYGRR